MKGFFLIFITLIPFLSINAQTKLPGKYRFHAENGEPGSLILNCDHTFLMEDTLIIRNDSSITSVVKGSWKSWKGKILILVIESIISDATPIGNLNEVRYYIKNGRIYPKLQNRRQYEMENRKLNRKYSENIEETREDYQTYKAKQNDRYFFPIEIFECKKK